MLVLHVADGKSLSCCSSEHAVVAAAGIEVGIAVGRRMASMLLVWLLQLGCWYPVLSAAEDAHSMQACHFQPLL